MLGFLAVNTFLSSNLIPFPICFASKLIASTKRGVAFLYILVILSFYNFLYSVDKSSYIFGVLSAGINTLLEAFPSAISAFIKFWNFLFMFLDLMDFTMSSRSFSNDSSSLICDRQFFDLKLEDSLSHLITLPIMKK